MSAITGFLGRAYAWLKARAAENSTRAGVGAALAALGAGAGTLGKPGAAVALLGTAAIAGIAAAVRADQPTAHLVTSALATERALAPLAVAAAEAASPKRAAEIASLAAEAQAAVGQVETAAKS